MKNIVILLALVLSCLVVAGCEFGDGDTHSTEGPVCSFYDSTEGSKYQVIKRVRVSVHGRDGMSEATVQANSSVDCEAIAKAVDAAVTVPSESEQE